MDTFKPTLAQRARLLATGHPVHALSASVPVLSYYGGATVTRTRDANKALFTVLCAKNLQLNAFGLYSLKDGVAQQIAPLVSGRGSIWVDLNDGTAEWVGFDGSAPPQGGAIPGFAPLSFGGQPGPPGPAGPAGSGSVKLFDAPVTSPAWEARVLSSGVWVDIPATFGVPSSSAYLVRLAAKAAAADVRARAGTEQAPYFLTVVTQAPGIENHTQGWVGGPAVWVSTVGGSATIWLQVEGMG